MKLIVPKERRVNVYSVLNNEIINARQKENHPNEFKVNVEEVNIKRQECFLQMSDENNKMSFVYVHQNGAMGIETNVTEPKYEFHKEYNEY